MAPAPAEAPAHQAAPAAALQVKYIQPGKLMTPIKIKFIMTVKIGNVHDQKIIAEAF